MSDFWARLKARRIAIRPAILTVIMALIIGSLAIVNFLWTKNNIDLARAVQEREAETIFGAARLKLHETFGAAPLILNKFARNFQIGSVDHTDFDAVSVLFAAELETAPFLSWISLGTRAEGAFVGATRRGDDVIINNSIPDRADGITQEWRFERDGSLTLVDAPVKDRFDPRNREWFYQAYLMPGVSWSKPYSFREGGLGITAVKAIVSGSPPTWVGAMTVDFNIDDIKDRLLEILEQVAGNLLMVIHGKEDVFLSVEENQEALVNNIKEVYLHQDRLDSSGILDMQVENSNKFEEFFYFASRVDIIEGLDIDLVYIVPVKLSAMGFVYDNTLRIVMISILIIIVTIFLTIYISRSIARPIEELGEVVADISLDDLDKYQPLKGHWLREIDDTQRTLNRMMSGLIKGEEIRSTFGRYIPQALASALEEGSVAIDLGGQELEITAIFTDIEGFTTISEQTSSKQMIGLINRYFEAVLEEIELCNGVVVDFIGDGIFAIFGAPIEWTEHRDMGISCALRLIARTEALEAELAAEGIKWGRTRIGLHSGRVIAGNVGGAGRQKYTALGDVVNTTARIESLNKQLGTRMLASAETVAQAQSNQKWRSLGKFQLVGKSDGLEVFEALGEDVDPEELALFSQCLETCHSNVCDAEKMVRDYVARYGEQKVLGMHLRHAICGEQGDVIVLNKK